jgi:homocysteine S-methyltransferase
LPPAGPDAAELIRGARTLADAGARILFVPDAPGGRAQLDAVAAAALVQRECGIPCVPHLNCRDRNSIALKGAVAALALQGLRGVKAVTGDPVAGEDPRGIYEWTSVDLTRAVHGTDLKGARSLTVVVGHALSADRDHGAEDRLRKKVEAGAGIIVTTPTLDPAQLCAALDRLAPLGVPMVVSLTLVPSTEVIDFLQQEMAGFRVPEIELARLREASSPDAAVQAGIASARHLVRSVRDRVAGFHVVPPFGRPDGAALLLEELIRVLT